MGSPSAQAVNAGHCLSCCKCDHSLEFMATVTPLRKSRLQQEWGQAGWGVGWAHAVQPRSPALPLNLPSLRCPAKSPTQHQLIVALASPHLISSWMPPGLEGSRPLNRMAKEAAMMAVWDSSTICGGREGEAGEAGRFWAHQPVQECCDGRQTTKPNSKQACCSCINCILLQPVNCSPPRPAHMFQVVAAGLAHRLQQE